MVSLFRWHLFLGKSCQQFSWVGLTVQLLKWGHPPPESWSAVGYKHKAEPQSQRCEKKNVLHLQRACKHKPEGSHENPLPHGGLRLPPMRQQISTLFLLSDARAQNVLRVCKAERGPEEAGRSEESLQMWRLPGGVQVQSVTGQTQTDSQRAVLQRVQEGVTRHSHVSAT